MGKNNRDNRRSKTQSQKANNTSATGDASTPGSDGANKSFNDQAVQASILTKSQLTVVIVVCIGVSRLLQLQRAIPEEESIATELCLSMVGESNAEICKNPSIATLLETKLATGIQTLALMSLTAISVWKREELLISLTGTWIFTPLLALLVLTAWMGQFAEDSHRLIWPNHMVYKTSLVLLVLIVVSFPESYQNLAWVGSFGRRRRSASVPSLACLTLAILSFKQAYDHLGQTKETVKLVVGSSSDNPAIAAAQMLVARLMGIDYLTLAGMALWSWRYIGAGDTNLQRIFWRNVSLVQAMAYLVQWPPLEQAVGDYELRRSTSLALALIGPIVYIMPDSIGGSKTPAADSQKQKAS